MRDSKRCVHTLAHNHSYSKDCCFSRKRGREVTASKAKVTLSHLSAAGKCVHDREIQWAPEATACTLNMVSSRHVRHTHPALDETFCYLVIFQRSNAPNCCCSSTVTTFPGELLLENF